MNCDKCGRNIEEEAMHSVVLIEGFTDVHEHHELDAGEVCNKCMFTHFAYCTECDMYYEKKYVKEEIHKCIWCIDNNK